jgi:hypothetical protein
MTMTDPIGAGQDSRDTGRQAFQSRDRQPDRARLNSGDIVLAYLPERTTGRPGKVARPAMVVWSHDADGTQQVELARARPDDRSPMRGREVKITGKGRQTGFEGTYRFDLGDRVTVAWTPEIAATPKIGQQPGPVARLSESAFNEAARAYGIAKTGERFRAEARKNVTPPVRPRVRSGAQAELS